MDHEFLYYYTSISYIRLVHEREGWCLVINKNQITVEIMSKKKNSKGIYCLL